MKLDTHVHTRHSGYSTHPAPPAHHARVVDNTPQDVYRMTRERGMDLVTITDHDTIAGLSNSRIDLRSSSAAK